MKKTTHVILTLLLAFFVQLSFAQERTISGTVSDEDGPLPEVSILIKGTTKGVVSDFDGNYSISAKTGDVLQFNSVGYSDVEKTVETSNTVNIVMKADGAIDDVVVVAYGTQKKESITGAIKVIKSDELATVQDANVIKGLSGKVAGVQVIQSAGQPGSSPTVRFRGIGSIAASSAPLYVVDGVPFNGNINSINPQDIESTSFLKDAASAALYGSRGANGVIIITTKKGRSDKIAVTFDTRVGVNTRSAKEYNLIKDPKDYLMARYNAVRNNFIYNNGLDPQTAANVAAQNLITNNNDLGTGILPASPINYNPYDIDGNLLIDPTTGSFNPNAKLLYREDWEDYLYNSNIQSESFLNVSKRNEKSSYYFSLGYFNNDGYVVNSGFNRITAQIKLDSKLLKFAKIGGNLRFSNTKQNNVDGDGSSAYSNPLSWSRSIAPIYPVFAHDINGMQILDANGNPQYDDGTGTIAPSTRPYGQLQNPVATALLDIFEETADNLSTQVFTDINITDDLVFTYRISGDLRNAQLTTLDTPLYGDAVTPNGRVYSRSLRGLSITQNQLLNWNKKINDNHNLSILLGHESFDYNRKFLSTSKSNLLLPDSPVLDHAAQLDGASNYERDYNVEGYFSRLKYNYASKYFLDASIRRDGSSVFHPDNRWGNFYGLGLAWRISKESFLENSSWLNELKLKASYGEQGNDAILYPNTSTRNYYAYQDQYALAEAGGTLALNLEYLGNKDITWEKNQNFNVGIDTEILDSRIRLSAEYFERNVSDMLFNKPLPPSSGNPSFPKNIGDMSNKGYEITLGTDIVKTDDFIFGFDFNITHFTNTITKLPQEFIDDGSYRLVEGRSRYDYFLREYAGVNPNNGAALYYKDILDVNDNPIGREITENWTEATKYFIGKTAIPDFYGGFSTKLGYKAFNLGFDFSYQLGGYGIDSAYWGRFNSESGENFHMDALTNTWTPERTNASLPRLDSRDSQYRFSDLYLIDASYLSLQNINLSYNLPSKFSKKLGLSAFKIYGIVNNVALWSKRQGYDPRLSLTGQSSDEYSLLSTKSIGITLTF